MSTSLPPLAPVLQTIPQPRLDDPAATIRQQILSSRLAERVPKGGSIALGVGSRGITAIPVLVRAAIDTLQEMSYRPFIVAAMGSHGGATADGQRDLLADYGITAAAMGVEVRTDMNVEVLGTNTVGLPIYFDRNALQADGIVLLNRVKPHTDFRGRHESGILKMLVIGLGKERGASQVHKLGLRGMIEVLPSVGAHLLEHTPFVLGLAVLENADDQPAEIHALEPERILEDEPMLLEKARQLMGRLPFDQIDVLVVGEIGKNYSGAGMDPNVIGRLMVETQPDFDRPRVTRLVALDVSAESHGNIVGVGFADLTTERLVGQMNAGPFLTNILTSCFLERARIPITLPSDREALEVAAETCWRINADEVRMVVIPNTLELKRLYVSRAMADEVQTQEHLILDGPFKPLAFDDEGRIDQAHLFPESVCGRRAAGAYATH